MTQRLRTLQELTLVLAHDTAAAAAFQSDSADQTSESNGYAAAQEARMRAALVVPRAQLPRSQRKYKSGTTGFMLAIHVGAVFALLPQYWSWQGVAVLAVLYWTTVIGVTLGLHRLVAHRSFVAPKWVERVLVVMGTLACQSGPIEWVGLHRHHHKFSDQPNDHHDAARGLWWAHSDWMLHEIPAIKEIHRFTGDMLQDPFYRWLDRWFLLLQIPWVQRCIGMATRPTFMVVAWAWCSGPSPCAWCSCIT